MKGKQIKTGADAVREARRRIEAMSNEDLDREVERVRAEDEAREREATIHSAQARIEHSVAGRYGEATGQVQGFGSLKGYASGGERRFARAEVLAVLRGHLALATARPPEMTERDALRALITVFERME